ncbi:hypothetical protein I4U23_026144 [Adineta vaga]|nr:hypothetical protein I4U23_026144 [Adineta vaga]
MYSTTNPSNRQTQLQTESLEIIAQPYYTSKLRYRSDYKSNQNRRGVLHSQNNPNYKSPAIRIPNAYLPFAEQYFIRVCLVTIENENTNCRYIHPYDLEDVENNQYNDRHNRVIWYPVLEEDVGGIKCFPNLRVVKKKADDLKNCGDLRIFDSSTEQSTPQLSSVKLTIKEYNLDKAQIAFTVGKKINDNGIFSMILFSSTTVFSDEMSESTVRDVDPDNVPTESNTNESAHCNMYKYTPRSGYQNANDEVLIFYTTKLKLKKYGDLQVKFECERPDGLWSQTVSDLEVKDQMVSFRTPTFEYPIDQITPVNIVLRQKRRTLESLIFYYIPIDQCLNCQRRIIEQSNTLETATNENKRRRLTLFDDDETTDKTTVIQEAHLESEHPSFSNTVIPFSMPPFNHDKPQVFLNMIADSIENLFSNNDLKPFLRLCRSFIRQKPHLLHQAIDNNHSDLLTKFIPGTNLDLFYPKNHLGESVLLHAVRLNRLGVVKALLERQNSDKLVNDVTNDGQNILHIVAKNKDSKEMLDVLIDYFDKEAIDIKGRFDNDDNTSFQLASLN